LHNVREAGVSWLERLPPVLTLERILFAVIWEFRARIGNVLSGMAKKEERSWRFAVNVVIATIPAVALALAFGHQIKDVLFNPIAVAVALIVGGLVILVAERRQAAIAPAVTELDDMTYLDAIKVGLAQTLAANAPAKKHPPREHCANGASATTATAPT
jgi:undecaprenyl-diphosphatase